MGYVRQYLIWVILAIACVFYAASPVSAQDNDSLGAEWSGEVSSQDIIETTTPVNTKDSVASTAHEQTKVDPSTAAELPTQQAPAPQQIVNNSTIVAYPSPVIANDAVIVSSFRFSERFGFVYVEVYNSSSLPTALHDVTIQLLYADETTDYECSIPLNGYVLPQQYISFAQQPPHGVYPLSGCPELEAASIKREIQIVRSGAVVESVRILENDFTASSQSKAWERRGWTATYREGVLAEDFKLSSRPDTLYVSQLYLPPPAPSLRLTEMLPNPQLCPPSDNRLECSKYIKVENTSNQAVDLSLYRLRSGHRDESPSTYNTSYLSGSIEPASFAIIHRDMFGSPLALDSIEAAVWFEDTYGIASYTNDSQPYKQANTMANSGRVWALGNNTSSWQWGQPNPTGRERVFPVVGEAIVSSSSELKPCRNDQERNPLTNRCRLIASTGSVLTACKAGQYRNPETNRCRSLATAASSSLKPCAAHQYRNPETNRCRSLASTTSTLKPCQSGYERNPATNRCRKATTSLGDTAGFAPEAVQEGAKAFTAWWALGGIIGFGVLWSGWEYRNEIRRIIQTTLSRGR